MNTTARLSERRCASGRRWLLTVSAFVHAAPALAKVCDSGAPEPLPAYTAYDIAAMFVRPRTNAELLHGGKTSFTLQERTLEHDRTRLQLGRPRRLVQDASLADLRGLLFRLSWQQSLPIIASIAMRPLGDSVPSAPLAELITG
jgi:hypothetical protein